LSAIRKFLNTRARSFQHAFQGCGYILRTQPNAWIHASFTLAVVILSAWLRLSPRDWAVIILTMALVWAAEIFNTAIEAVINLASPDHHSLAKTGKDAAAGAVLVTAIGSVLIGLLILGPPLWNKLQSLLH
jgi:diacylglycerol kinase (ATP)